MRYVFAIVAAAGLLLGTAQAQYNQAPPPPANSPAYNNQIPSGTQIAIRTNEPIQADKNNVGRSYSAQITQDILGANGQVLVPRGSPATLAVVQHKGGALGAISGDQVALALQTITVNGQTMNVQTDAQTAGNDRGIGKNKRTAEYTGGGAVLGTLIGAVAGGAKGAVIGAVVGGAAGAGTQVATKGSNINVPAESVLTFKLDQPLYLQTY